jgi:hypothetical protein
MFYTKSVDVGDNPSIYNVEGNNRLSSFRGEECKEINQSETRIACGGHVCYRIETK